MGVFVFRNSHLLGGFHGLTVPQSHQGHTDVPLIDASMTALPHKMQETFSSYSKTVGMTTSPTIHLYMTVFIYPNRTPCARLLTVFLTHDLHLFPPMNKPPPPLPAARGEPCSGRNFDKGPGHIFGYPLSTASNRRR